MCHVFLVSPNETYEVERETTVDVSDNVSEQEWPLTTGNIYIWEERKSHILYDTSRKL